MQLQALQQAAAEAINHVGARGETVVARLEDIPLRVNRVAILGAAEGAARALTLAHLETGADFYGLHPLPPPGTDEDDEFDIRQAHGAVAADIAGEVSPFTILNRLREEDDQADQD